MNDEVKEKKKNLERLEAVIIPLIIQLLQTVSSSLAPPKMFLLQRAPTQLADDREASSDLPPGLCSQYIHTRNTSCMIN